MTPKIEDPVQRKAAIDQLARMLDQLPPWASAWVSKVRNTQGGGRNLAFAKEAMRMCAGDSPATN